MRRTKKISVLLGWIIVTFVITSITSPVWAHPGKPDFNFAEFRAHGGDCSLFEDVIVVHDASGNTYRSLSDACRSGKPVFWLGPAH